MTRPPGYPGRPDFGDDPYGRPGYGSDPYGQPPPQDPYGGYQGSHRDPYGGHGPPQAHPAAAPGHPGYDAPPAPRHGHPDPPPYGHPDPRYGHPDPRYGHPEPPRYAHPERAPYPRPEPRPYPQPRPPAPRRRGLSLVLGIVGGVVALLLLAGAAFVLLGNDSGVDPGRKAAASPSADPDLADPGKVVDRWLNAMFILKDAQEMLRYTCKRESDRDEADDAVRTVKKAEQDAKDAKLTMKVTWSKPRAVSTAEKTSRVTSTLKVVVGDKTERKPATFDLVYEAGWKVCDTEMR